MPSPPPLQGLPPVWAVQGTADRLGEREARAISGAEGPGVRHPPRAARRDVLWLRRRSKGRLVTVHYSDESVTLHHGDCLDVLRGLPDNSVDAVVCDPPYGLANTTPEQVADTLVRWIN